MEEVISGMYSNEVSTGSERVQEFISEKPLLSFVVLPSVVLLLAGGVIGASMLFISMLL